MTRTAVRLDLGDGVLVVTDDDRAWWATFVRSTERYVELRDDDGRTRVFPSASVSERLHGGYAVPFVPADDEVGAPS